MAHVSVIINGRSYDIACDDGQEAHLTRLAAYVDKRLTELVAAVGQVGDTRLLVMVSLLVADELSDAYAELAALRSEDEEVAARLEADEVLGSNIEMLAQRIESLAEHLERA
jgi:cell division protein ZapA